VDGWEALVDRVPDDAVLRRGLRRTLVALAELEEAEGNTIVAGNLRARIAGLEDASPR
jgi:hypothetical protein